MTPPSIDPNDPFGAFHAAAIMTPKPPEQQAAEDPRDSDDYAQFIEESAKLCSCDPAINPCDGILAGGLCDHIRADDPPRGPFLCQDGCEREDEEP